LASYNFSAKKSSSANADDLSVDDLRLSRSDSNHQLAGAEDFPNNYMQP
jgi:hypothetical protein